MRTITTIIISLMTMAIQAQNVLTKATNGYIGTGRHMVQQVRCVGSQNDSRCWDFSNLESVTPKYTVWHVDKEDSLLQTLVIERGTRYTYCMKGDSLLISGYRSRLSEICYDEQEAYLLFPMTVGDSIQGIFHGRGTYGDKMAMRHYGDYKTKADAIGTILLPDNDSIQNVLKVHTDRLISNSYYPITQLDSLAPYTADSVAMYLQTDTAIISASIDRWYAPGYRYPVIETRKIVEGNEESQLSQTIYYSTDQQETDHPDDGENVKIRSLLAEEEKQNNIGNDSKQNSSDSSWKINNIKVNVSGATVNISCDLLADASVTALVCDVSGIVYRQQSQTGRAGESCQMTILCDGLRHGQYVLCLNVNGQVKNQTISL